MITLPLVIFTSIFLLITFTIKWWKFLNLASKIPSIVPNIPLIGIFFFSLGKNLNEIFEFSQEFIKKTKDIGKVWQGPLLFVVVKKPDFIQKVLNSRECLDKPNFFKFLDIQEASLFGTLDAWRRHRKIINPAFSPNVLKEFIPIFNEKSRFLIEILKEKIDGSEFDVYPFMSRLFLETILCTALDFNFDVQRSENRDDYVKYFEAFYDATTSRISKLWLHITPIYKLTKFYEMEQNGRQKSSLKFTEDVFQKGKKTGGLESEQNFSTNVVQLLFNPKHQLTDREIREEIFSIIMAGQDTTTITVSAALLMLGIHKEIQQKVFEELCTVFTNFDDPVDFEDLNNLPYLEMVIKETMRLFPVAAFTFRTVIEDFKVGNYTIPAGAHLVIPVYAMHRDKTQWGEDAELFIPERFEDERFKEIHPYAYIPFTAGPRRCIGYRYTMIFMKTCLSNFLRQYEVDSKVKYEDISCKISITMKLNQPSNISLKKRNF